MSVSYISLKATRNWKCVGPQVDRDNPSLQILALGAALPGPLPWRSGTPSLGSNSILGTQCAFESTYCSNAHHNQ